MSISNSGRIFASVFLVVTWIVTTGCNGSTDRRQTDDGSDRSQAPKAETTSEADLLSLAREQLKAGATDQAAVIIYRLLVKEPDNIDASFLAGQIESARGNHATALDLASSIPLDSRLGKGALQFRAEQLLQLERYSQAADIILKGLQQSPSQTMWRHNLWRVLTRIGRREEASVQATELCKRGSASEQELMSLVRRNGSFPLKLKQGEEAAEQFEPGLGIARWHFTNEEFRKALKELQPQYKTEFENSAARALYGRLLAETQAFEEFPRWHAACDATTRKHSDYFAALGTFFFDQREYIASADALLKAVYQNPTDRTSTQRLAKVFDALGRPEDGEQFRLRGIQLFKAEREVSAYLEAKSNMGLRQQLTRRIMELGRPFETLQWTLSRMPPQAVQQRATINQQRQQLLNSDDALKMAAESALVGIDPSPFDMTSALNKLLSEDAPRTNTQSLLVEQLAAPRMVDVAAKVGIDFRWYQDLEIDISSIPIHESVGGGIAVIDYDLDGWPDVYFAQGSGEPPTNRCTRSSQLMRNRDGRFKQVTEPATATDFNYSSGITAGDVNQDGFADLFLGSLGHSRLLINNGDGTFRDATTQLGDVSDKFTSSVAIADINGDRLPDLFEAIYIEMEGAFDLPKKNEKGIEIQPSPLEHYAQSDRWFQNLGDGGFKMIEITRNVARPGTALGVVATDFDDNGTIEVFVGNDVRPNHYLVQTGENELSNAADASGVANGYSGSANGCMGIASGDFNRDGKIDLHITNFSLESNNLYVQTSAGGFSDLAVRHRLDQPSWPFVGFGTKAIDFDRNGWLDLVVTNGHIFDMREFDEPFLMPPQFFANHGTHFEVAKVNDDSGYWNKTYLGRSMATIDFNRDGAIDLLIGHLDQPTAVLKNETSTAGNWVQVELVGTESERDAIGAKVTVSAGDETFSQWVTAGDGYFCNDESVLDFGIGRQKHINRIEVLWPAGDRQIIEKPDAQQRHLVIEGQPATTTRLP